MKEGLPGRNKVKTGYKNTEIGVIPDDWMLKRFKEISWVNQGLQIAISRRLKSPTNTSKTYITIQFLNNRKEVEYIDLYSPSVTCNKDDVLMTRTGNTGIIVTGFDGVFHNNFFKINFDKKILSKDFLVFYLSLPRIRRLILDKAGTSTIPDLNHNDFYSIPIPLPPTLEEQRVIATTLSDTDVLISSLDKLITKKKNIKQAAMQQLLTGKKRLPGFNGEWKETKLGNMLFESPRYGINAAAVDYSDKLPLYIRITDITEDGKFSPGKKVSVNRIDYKNYLLEENDFVFARTGASTGKTYLYNSNDGELVYAGFLIKVKVDQKKLIAEYLKFFAQTDAYWNWVRVMSMRSGQPGINGVEYQQLPVYLPEEVDEQKAISQVLSDMDSEIEALEQKRDKYKAIKQGMMQQLLTGKIRLAS